MPPGVDTVLGQSQSFHGRHSYCYRLAKLCVAVEPTHQREAVSGIAAVPAVPCGQTQDYSDDLELYFPVTVDVMRRVACHGGEALLFAVYDGRRCRGGSGRWGT